METQDRPGPSLALSVPPHSLCDVVVWNFFFLLSQRLLQLSQFHHHIARVTLSLSSPHSHNQGQVRGLLVHALA